MRLEVEIYKEGNAYGAYIGDNCGGSGISVEGSTPEELSENLKPYIADYAYNLENSD